MVKMRLAWIYKVFGIRNREFYEGLPFLVSQQIVITLMIHDIQNETDYLNLISLDGIKHSPVVGQLNPPEVAGLVFLNIPFRYQHFGQVGTVEGICFQKLNLLVD